MEALLDFFIPENGERASLPPEPGEGNIEYKLKLVNISASRFEHLVTQLKWRLREGHGEAIYEIGVEDNGLLAGLPEDELRASLDTLCQMAKRLGATTSVIRERVVENHKSNCGPRLKVAEVLIRKVPDDQHTIELRVAVVGNMDAGKSTLLGVLTHGEMDNGDGRARINLFRHKHELKTGQTSSISHEILGFDSQGNAVNYRNAQTAEEICESSSKLITFIDLAGHQKYLKTTIFGLTGHCPHFAMLVVSALSGLAGTAREHFSIAVALQMPVFVVVSKVDACNVSAVTDTLEKLEQLIKEPSHRRVPLRVATEDDAITAATNLAATNVTPIFTVSNVTGQGLELLVKFLNVLPPSLSVKEREVLLQQQSEFQVDETFRVPNVGCVVGGLLTRGTLREGDEVHIGPTDEGYFLPAYVQSVYRNRSPCQVVRAGQSASVSLGNLDVAIRKGMVLLSPRGNHQSCLYFQANICVLSHTTAIYRGFQAVIYVGNIRQPVTIAAITPKVCIQTNDCATVIFKFMNHPEHLRVGAHLLFRDRYTKGIGQVTHIFPLENIIR